MAASVISYPVPERTERTGAAGADSAGGLNAQGTAQGPTLRIVTAPFGHPHHGRPLILVGGVEVAWCSDPLDAQRYVEFLEEHPELTATLAEAADDYVDDPTRGWRA